MHRQIEGSSYFIRDRRHSNTVRTRVSFDRIHFYGDVDQLRIKLVLFGDNAFHEVDKTNPSGLLNQTLKMSLTISDAGCREGIGLLYGREQWREGA